MIEIPPFFNQDAVLQRRRLLEYKIRKAIEAPKSARVISKKWIMRNLEKKIFHAQQEVFTLLIINSFDWMAKHKLHQFFDFYQYY